ncbi:MAG: metallophosphoesterase [Firmicutes bacterium]|nr:metallophosphoesterase [[Eubacterium] siraeum]MCM1486892.1 metallophosphoesterase [Bacillota bacterium]
MATYCISDIHGDYERYRAILQKINLRDRDTLYVIGDVIDRGKDSLKILKDMMMRVNVIPIIGNHEYMAINCLKFLMKDITKEEIAKLDKDIVEGLLEWQNVGGQTTIDEFHRLSAEDKEDIIDYLSEFTLYEEAEAGGKSFVLVHAGLEGFDPDKSLDDYKLHEMIFNTPDYSRVYFKDKYLVTGHLPTAFIEENPEPNKIFKANNHIAIDCGCGMGMEDGRLGAICLDDFKEYYV